MNKIVSQVRIFTVAQNVSDISLHNILIYENLFIDLCENFIETTLDLHRARIWGSGACIASISTISKHASCHSASSNPKIWFLIATFCAFWCSANQLVSLVLKSVTQSRYLVCCVPLGLITLSYGFVTWLVTFFPVKLNSVDNRAHGLKFHPETEKNVGILHMIRQVTQPLTLAKSAVSNQLMTELTSGQIRSQAQGCDAIRRIKTRNMIVVSSRSKTFYDETISFDGLRLFGKVFFNVWLP